MQTGNSKFLDAHVHLYPSRRLSGLIRWMHKAFPDHPVPKDATLDHVLLDLERHGYENFVALVFPIDAGESVGLNSFIAEMAENIPGLTPFGCVHKDDPSPASVAEQAIVEMGLAGLKFHPMVQRFDPWDRKLFGVFQRMNEWRKPVYIHTGFDDWYGYSLPDGSLRSLLQTFPDIPFVFCHMLFPRLELAFELVEEFPNLHLDATNVFGTIALFRSGGLEIPGLDLDKVREGIELHSGRIMFGTDHPAGMGTIDGILRDFYDFGLTAGAASRILHGTASAFLRENCSAHYTPEI